MDNKTIEALKEAQVYKKLGQRYEISWLECLSHVVKMMKINPCNRQEAVLQEDKNDKKAEYRYLMKEKQMSSMRLIGKYVRNRKGL